MAPTRPCPRTGKVGYAHDDAERLAKRARRREDEPVQAYRCRHCRTWHIGHRGDGR